MPRLPVRSVDDANSDSRQALSALHARYGKVLNIHGEILIRPLFCPPTRRSTRPSAARAPWMAVPARPSPWRPARPTAVTTASRLTRSGGKAAGLSADQTVAIPAGQVDFDPKLAALVAVARQAATNVRHVDGRHLAGRPRRRLERHANLAATPAGRFLGRQHGLFSRAGRASLDKPCNWTGRRP